MFSLEKKEVCRRRMSMRGPMPSPVKHAIYTECNDVSGHRSRSMPLKQILCGKLIRLIISYLSTEGHVDFHQQLKFFFSFIITDLYPFCFCRCLLFRPPQQLFAYNRNWIQLGEIWLTSLPRNYYVIIIKMN